MNKKRKKPMTSLAKDALLVLLETYNVPLQKYGEGKAKTLDHLLAELNAGEAIIAVKDGQIIRYISTVALNVYYVECQKTWLLVEDRQVFSDGRSRRRNLSTSLGEKLKFGEKPETVAQRALKEELGVNENLTLVPKPVFEKPLLPSESFPGIYTANVLYQFDVFLSARFYNPNGYVEQQRDKATHFVWKLLDDEAPR